MSFRVGRQGEKDTFVMHDTGIIPDCLVFLLRFYLPGETVEPGCIGEGLDFTVNIAEVLLSFEEEDGAIYLSPIVQVIFMYLREVLFLQGASSAGMLEGVVSLRSDMRSWSGMKVSRVRPGMIAQKFCIGLLS